MRGLTFYPVGVHLDDLVNDLDRESAFPLGLPDLFGVAALVVDEVEDVQSHGGV